MDPEQIRKKAERLKSEQQTEKKKQSVKKKTKVYKAKHAGSRYIFNKIYPYIWNIFIWVYVVLTIGVVMIGTYYINYRDTDWVLYVGLILIATFIIRLIIFQIVKFNRYASYKDWEKNLNFEVKGWDNLGTKDDFPKIFYWDMNVSLSVSQNSYGTPEGKKLIHSALYLLVNDINKSFYPVEKVQKGSWGDPRKKWEFNSELNILGSADGKVLGHIYLCISKNLKSIQKRYGNIQSVDIKFSGNIQEIQRLEVPKLFFLV